MRFAIIALIALIAVTAGAEKIVLQHKGGPTSGDPEWEPAKDVELKWYQAPGESTVVSSQDFYDVPALSECADDFECNDPRAITAIEWWGGYWNYGSELLSTVEFFVIRFYDDVPGPPFSHPGTLLYEEACYVFTEEFLFGTEPDPLFYHYYQDLEVDFEQEPGNIYWISIQAVYSYEGGGQWGLRPSHDHWNDELAFKSLYFQGDEDWHPATEVFGYAYDLSFALYVDVMNPVEATTWSGIKGLFR